MKKYIFPSLALLEWLFLAGCNARGVSAVFAWKENTVVETRRSLVQRL